MKPGMLWYDNLNNKNLDERVERAVNYFIQKYGEQPRQCFVHPAMLDGEKGKEPCVKVVADEKILQNHIWVEFPQAE